MSSIISSQECDFDWFSSSRMFNLFWYYLMAFSSPILKWPQHENLHLIKLSSKSREKMYVPFRCGSSHPNTDLLMNRLNELHLKTSVCLYRFVLCVGVQVLAGVEGMEAERASAGVASVTLKTGAASWLHSGPTSWAHQTFSHTWQDKTFILFGFLGIFSEGH